MLVLEPLALGLTTAPRRQGSAWVTASVAARAACTPCAGHLVAAPAVSPVARRASGLMCFYELHGGLATADEFAGQLGRHMDQPISCVARWLVRRQVLSFRWQAQTLLPLFQFDADLLAVREPVQQVLAELTCVFSEDELADWFAQPNALLHGMAPWAALADDALLQAARAERFCLRG